MTFEILGIAITIWTVSVVRWLDSHQNQWIKLLLNWVPAVLLAYVFPSMITHLGGLDLSHITLHTWSRDLVMPLAILTVMSALSYRQLRSIGYRPIVLFAIGSFAIAIAPIILVWSVSQIAPDLFDEIMNQSYWMGMVTLVGSWIGGSTSQLVLKEVVGCPEDIFIIFLLMDNVLVNIWTILMFQFIRRSDQWNRIANISDRVPDFIPDQIPGQMVASNSIFTLVSCILITILSFYLMTSFLWKIIALSIVGLLLGNFLKGWDHALVLRLGTILILVIMAILGLRLRFESFTLPFGMIILSVIWLIGHFVVMLIIARWMQLHMAWVPIASMANVGGISTAPAVTAAYQEEWMPHAIVLAILSMVSGTTWGLLTISLFQWF